MQVIIMAAGKSTRMYPLSLTIPKPLMKIADKTLLEHNIEILRELIDEIIIVAGYKIDMIREAYKDSHKIRVVEQKEQLGTWHVIKTIEPYIKDRFVVINGDDIYSREDIQKCMKHGLCILARKSEKPPKQGALIVSGDRLLRVEEKPLNPPDTHYANSGLYIFDRRAFDVEMKPSERGEYEITDLVSELAQSGDFCFEVRTGYWFPIGYPWHIPPANKFFLDRMKGINKGNIKENVKTTGEVSTGKESIIESGTIIEGPVLIGKNCSIGNNCIIRPYSIIRDNSKIGDNVEISNSSISENVTVANSCKIIDSIIGKSVIIEEGCSLIRENKKEESYKDILVDSNRELLGAVIADNCKLSKHTVIKNGAMLWPGMTTSENEVITEDKKNKK